jgi:hypothetical protein
VLPAQLWLQLGAPPLLSQADSLSLQPHSLSLQPADTSVCVFMGAGGATVLALALLASRTGYLHACLSLLAYLSRLSLHAYLPRLPVYHV